MVYLAQCLCPRRHCIMAMAYESRDGETREQAEATARRMLEMEVDRAVKRWLDPWCGLCQERRPRWHMEVGVTEWRTMAEARPALAAAEADQLATAEAAKAAKN